MVVYSDYDDRKIFWYKIFGDSVMKMPIIDLDIIGMSNDERELAVKILGRENRIRSSKPKDGEAAYLWRMVAFDISPKRQHHCMPMMADCDMATDVYWGTPENNERRRIRFQELDDWAQRITKSVPVNERHGLVTWARVLL